MKKLTALFLFISFFFSSLNAQVNTLSNIDVSDTLEVYPVNTQGQWGLMTGQNSYYDLSKAEFYNYSGPPSVISQVTLHFGYAISANPNTIVWVKVWEENGNSMPGVVLDSQIVYLQDIVNDVANGDSTTVLFNGVNVSGPFFVGYDLPYATGDTFGVYSNRDGNTPSPGTAWERWSGGLWVPFSDPTGWGIDVSLAVYPTLTTTPYKIIGMAYDDANSNCSQDLGEGGLKNIKLNVWNAGNYQAHIYTYLDGSYTVFVPDSGEYFITPELGGSSIQINCGNGGITDTLWVNGTVSDDFSLHCGSGFDVKVQSVNHGLWVAPGQIHTLNVEAGDLSSWYGFSCSAGTSGQVEVSVAGPVSYVGPANGSLIPSVSASGNTFTYLISDFGQVNMSQDFGLMFSVDTTALMGDMICVDVLVNPIAGDNNPSNNSLNYCYFVQVAVDPNIKEVYPEKVLPGYQDYLTYTIHFQNIGNSPAFNIRLRDTLDGQLAPETFEVLSYSHPNQVTLTGKYLTVLYPNIMLADSFSDPVGSIGYIQYRIKLKNPLLIGAQVTNSASIYFDYNAPIQTNTAYTVCEVLNAIHAPENTLSFKIHPNPTGEHFQIVMEEEYKNLFVEVVDIQGNILYKETFSKANETNIRFNASSGIYFVKVQADNNPALYRKLVKE